MCVCVCLQLPGGAFVLADYEHSGKADELPVFNPLVHWPPECKVQGAPYTRAADIYGVGMLLADAGPLDGPARGFLARLTAEDASKRPSAFNILRTDAWLSS